MTQRKQQVVIEGESSESCYVDSSVPQGTGLDPLLFLCHRTIFLIASSQKSDIFADDCFLYTSVNSIKDQIQLQEYLESLENWANKPGIGFNATKCYIMSIHRAKVPLTYHYSLTNHKMEQVNKNPFLGLTISDNLK